VRDDPAFHDDPRALDQPRFVEGLDNGFGRLRRHAQVVQAQWFAVDLVLGLGHGLGQSLRTPRLAHEAEVPGEVLPRSFGEPVPGELVERAAGARSCGRVS